MREYVPEISTNTPRDRDRDSLDSIRMQRQRQRKKQQQRQKKRSKRNRCDANEDGRQAAVAMMNWLAAAGDKGAGLLTA